METLPKRSQTIRATETTLISWSSIRTIEFVSVARVVSYRLGSVSI